MNKNIVLLFLVLFAVSESKYHLREIRNQPTCYPGIAGTGFAVKTEVCSFDPKSKNYKLVTSNGTYIETHELCEKDCKKCEKTTLSSISCSTRGGWTDLNYVSNFPKIKENGFVLEFFYDKECKQKDNRYFYLMESLCFNDNGSQNIKWNYETNEGEIKDFDQKDCTGKVVRHTKFPHGKCSKFGDSFVKPIIKILQKYTLSK